MNESNFGRVHSVFDVLTPFCNLFFFILKVQKKDFLPQTQTNLLLPVKNKFFSVLDFKQCYDFCSIKLTEKTVSSVKIPSVLEFQLVHHEQLSTKQQIVLIKTLKMFS